ncbi:MAG: TIGR04282 family arsenosugar biosynthesis glycosyltransferase [Solirubrobacteraceae bacterium]
MSAQPAVMVIAKDPRPGYVKTRLCPPLSPDQAAQLAVAALADTLDVVAATPAARRVLVLDGAAGRWRRPGIEVIAQRGDGLAERLGHAFAAIAGPALLVGMDTPQLTPSLLIDGLTALSSHDAVLGPAHDGGYWSIGLRRPDPEVFAGVPMSTRDTLRHQRSRLRSLGLTLYEQSPLRDVDTEADARAVAALAPGTRFGRAVEALGGRR